MRFLSLVTALWLLVLDSSSIIISIRSVKAGKAAHQLFSLYFWKQWWGTIKESYLEKDTSHYVIKNQSFQLITIVPFLAIIIQRLQLPHTIWALGTLALPVFRSSGTQSLLGSGMEKYFNTKWNIANIHWQNSESLLQITQRKGHSRLSTLRNTRSIWLKCPGWQEKALDPQFQLWCKLMKMVRITQKVTHTN